MSTIITTVATIAFTIVVCLSVAKSARRIGNKIRHAEYEFYVPIELPALIIPPALLSAYVYVLSNARPGSLSFDFSHPTACSVMLFFDLIAWSFFIGEIVGRFWHSDADGFFAKDKTYGMM